MPPENRTKWTDVRLPEGAILRNWPLLAGGGVSVILLIGIIVSAPDEPVFRDPLADAEEEAREDIQIAEPISDVGGFVEEVEQAAARAAAEEARREREEARQRQRDERLRQAADRQARAELRTAREQLERYRARRAAGQDAGFEALGSGNADVADLRAALELEEVTRESEALRSPLVVSSARQLFGGRSHELVQQPPRQYGGGSVSAAPPAASPAAQPVQSQVQPQPPRSPLSVPGPAVPGGGPGTAPSPSPGGVGAGTAVDGAPPQPQVFGGGPGGGPAPPPGRVGTGPAGTFTLGPPADGGVGAPPSGIVVTPNDGVDYRLYEGTLIAGALQTQIQADFEGPISAQVTRPAYSRDRRRVLVPRGTVFLGTAGAVGGPFQERMVVGFHRMIFPDGRWVRLDGGASFWGLSAIGEASLRDQVNRHYIQSFGTAGAVGLLAALSQGSSGNTVGVGSLMGQNTAQMALQLMSRFMNRRPTVTIRAGHRLNIRVMSDLIIPSDVAHELD